MIDLKSHLISHIDHNIQLIENQFVQQERNRIDVDECNSNLWYAKLRLYLIFSLFNVTFFFFSNNSTTLEGLKKSYYDSGIPIQNGIIIKISLGCSVVQIEQPNIENLLLTKVYSIDSRNNVDSDLNVVNAVNSVVPVHHESVNVAESFNASSGNSKEYKNDKVYECSKCSRLFYDRSTRCSHKMRQVSLTLGCSAMVLSGEGSVA